jgi:hypothetical protein
MASRISPLSESDNPLVMGIRRAGVSRANRTLLIFLAPFLLVGAGYLSTDSANNPDSSYQFFGQNNDAGVVLNAVAVPRYIPQNLPNYQETIVPAPDLIIAKANDTGGNATVGVPFTWTLTVTNAETADGTFSDTQTILRDTLPTGPAYSDPTAGAFSNVTNSDYISCSIVSDELTCTANGADVTIIAGGSFTVTFSATPATPGVLANTAMVDPDDHVAESNEGNNTGSDTVSVTALAPDLTIAKANDTGGNATVGVPFTWTLTVANGGTAEGTFANTQTILRDPLPAGPVYGSPSAGNFVNITNSGNISCSIASDELTCTASGADVTIIAGGSFTVTFSATPATTDSLNNTATVDPDDSVAESNESNNTGSDTVSVTSPAPDLTITKVNNTGGNATVGVPFNWTLTVANGGTSDGTFTDGQTILQDTLPAGPGYGTPTAGNFFDITNSEYISCSIASDELTCTANGGDVTIIAGGGFTVTFSATPATTDSLNNTATVDPDDHVAESNEGNNAGSDSVSVTYPAPANDDFAGAIAVLPLPFLSNISTVYATTNTDDPEISCIADEPWRGTKSVWYAYTATKYESIIIDTTASNYDTVIAVWRGTRLNLTEVACSEDTTLGVALVAGTTYYIEVAQSGGDTGGALDFYVESDIFHGLRADYFNNVDLSGTPVLTRIDPFIGFDWTGISPAPEVNVNNFSVRWSGRILPQYTETYTFHTYSDDGVRLWVDNQLIIDNWSFHTPTWDTGVIDLTAGNYYSIRMEYFQSSGTGVARLEWSSASQLQERIPTGALDYLDMVNSTVVGDDVQPLADGVATSAITVTLLDSYSHPVVGIPVYMKASGSGNRINGFVADPDVWVLIGYSNSSGVVIGYLASTIAGEKMVGVMAGGVGVGSPLAVIFVNGPVRRISVSHIPGQEGDQSNADTYYPSVSADGSRVVFISWADNLVPNDLNSNPDIFILNKTTNSLSPAIFAESGGQPNDLVLETKISGNGQYVVFTSIATNLSADCTDSIADIYVYQIQEGAPGVFTCISLGLGGAEANAASEHPSISYDGRYVVFASSATNLVAGVTDGRKHIYLYDRNTLTLTVESVNSDEVLADGSSDNPSISADGQSIAFESLATNLLGPGGDTNGVSDIFLRNRNSGVTTRVSMAYTSGAEPDGSSILPSISSDGKRIAFLSIAGNLIPGISGVWNVYLRDVPSNTTSLASISTSGGGANGNAFFARISADGKHVAFSSTATNLILGESGGTEQMYLRDFEDSETLKISVSATGEEGNAASNTAGISGDGTIVAFLSSSTNLVAGDTNGFADAFLSERVALVRAPSNDDFASALSPSALPYSNIESTLGATRAIDDPELSCGGGSPSQHYNSVWFTIQPSNANRLSLSTVGSDYDTVLAVWTGTEGSLTEVACNDDTGGSQSTVSFLPAIGTRYYIEIVQKDAPGGGSLVFSIQEITAPPVYVYVFNTNLVPDAGVTVQAYNGDTFTGFSVVTNSGGEAVFVLPEGSYRFKATKNGTAFWSGGSNHCTVPGCPDVEIVTTIPVTVTVLDTNGNPEVGMEVQAFSGSTYSGYSAITNSSGQASLTLPVGSYNFRALKNGTSFWSGVLNHCAIPGCTTAGITTQIPVAVTVLDANSNPVVGVEVQAYNGSTYTGVSATTNAQGLASLTLPVGSYRFKTIVNGSTFWSDTANHCSVPGCTTAGITVPSSVVVTVLDTGGNPEVGLAVMVYDGSTYTGIAAVTNAEGKASFSLLNGSYRFAATKNGTVFWSNTENDCNIPGCTAGSVTTTVPVVISVLSNTGVPLAGLNVWAFDGSTYSGYTSQTNAQGQATFTLPQGNYRFRVDYPGYQFWSNTVNHCSVPGCTSVNLTLNVSVTVTVKNGTFPDADTIVYAYDGDTYTGISGTTNAQGQVVLTLPAGNYRFQAYKSGARFWSSTSNHCTIPAGCSTAAISTLDPVLVTVQDTGGTLEAGFTVTAYNGSTSTGISAVTNSQGQATLWLPAGSYRFHTAKNGTPFWSNTVNHCTIRGCSSAGITTTIPVVLTVVTNTGIPQAGLKVWAFNGTTYSGYGSTTDAQGHATLTLPQGNYRFRVDYPGYQFWSGTVNHCAVPGCTAVTVTLNLAVTITVQNGTFVEPGVNVWAFNGSTYAGVGGTTNAQGQVTLTLPLGSYRFRVDKPGYQFWSGTTNHCTIPNCTTLSVATRDRVEVTVLNTGGAPQVGLTVVAYVGTAYSGYAAVTDSQGKAVMWLPANSYHFRANKDGVPFWSGADNHCTVRGCTTAGITIPIPVVVTVVNTNGTPQSNIPVWSFNGTTWTGQGMRTNAQGQAFLYLPAGDYRFRVDIPGRQYWTGPTNHCTVPTCLAVTQTVYIPILVTVQDTSGNPEVGLNILVYNGSTYAGFSAATNAQGQASFPMLAGSYRFRTTKNGTAFWSGTSNHCTVPGCTSTGITTTVPVVVTVQTSLGQPEPGLKVYAMNGDVWTGYLVTTDSNGHAAFTLPQGSYRFRVDKPGDPFYWSGPTNHCTVPGCTAVTVTTGGGGYAFTLGFIQNPSVLVIPKSESVGFPLQCLRWEII